MKLYRVDKTVLIFKNGAKAFLGGLTSNAMDRPWNAFLNIHGKIIATFDQRVLNDDEVLAVIERPLVDAVLGHLDRYMRLSGVTVEKRDHRVYFDLEGNIPAENDEFAIPQKHGKLLVSRRDRECPVSDGEFLLFRLRHNIPWPGVDYQDDFALNVSEDDFVSYTKGCYLGQEPVSKVHSRSRPTWKLAVRFEDECDAEQRSRMTSKALDEETGRVRGFVFTKNS
ncbi:MAG: hypothetical protein Q8Q08_00515 [Candidatus Omnitrophota bacterium]|nr:hypothetical protein [Candidatus Omnitrophota bacterium]MDZ4241896.1 hypothetical protein [Candidatus Omnitrophota bacterium]